MDRHKIPSPRYEVCATPEEAQAFVKQKPFGFPFVIKADGLAAGKGTRGRRRTPRRRRPPSAR